MRKKLVQIVATISLVVATMAGAAHAQTLADRIKVNIPFDFQIAETKLPAGEYYVRRPPQSSSDTILMMSNVHDGRTILRLTSAVQTLEPKNKATLVFHRYGDQYFLFQVWPAGGETGRALPKSRSEREAKEKDFVGTNKGREVETVTIVSGQ